MKNHFKLFLFVIIPAVITCVAFLLIIHLEQKKITNYRNDFFNKFKTSINVFLRDESINTAKDTQDFVENYLKKYLDVYKTCDNSKLLDCGLETRENKIFSLKNEKMSMATVASQLTTRISVDPNFDETISSYGILLKNGVALNVFYNPKCMSDNVDSYHYGQSRVCVNVIYDLNGLKKPNHVGEDIGFLSVLYPDKKQIKVVSPNPYKTNADTESFQNSKQKCTEIDPNLILPDRDELLSMYMNSNLLGIGAGYFWSSSEASNDEGWMQNFHNGHRHRYLKSTRSNIRCVFKR